MKRREGVVRYEKWRKRDGVIEQDDGMRVELMEGRRREGGME